MKTRTLTAWLIGAFLSNGCLQAQTNLPDAGTVSNSFPLAFVASGTNEFSFDTGFLKGKLRANGRSIGFTPLTHVPSGVAMSRGSGLLNHYRVFTTNTRYGGGMRELPSEAKLNPDGSVEAVWPARAEQPFELRAIYRVSATNALDVETVVTARTNLSNFEVFVASYFRPNFSNALVYAEETPGKKGFIAAERAHGDWQIFPRAASEVRIIQDGRWALLPDPIEWTVMPRLAGSVAVRRDPGSGLTAVIMTPPQDCFAISTPYETEGHYSIYLSLFGRDVKSGETLRARSRLLVGTGGSETDILRAYESYLKE